MLVDSAVLDEFVPRFVTAARALKVGPPSDTATDIGPMVHAGAAERVMAMVADAVERGAKLALTPERSGATISPGILTGVTRDSRLWNEEVFGPIVLVTAFDGVYQAIELADDSDFGLQGAVFARVSPMPCALPMTWRWDRCGSTRRAAFVWTCIRSAASSRAVSDAKASNTPWKNCRRSSSLAVVPARVELPMTAITLLKAKIMHHRRPVREKSNKKAVPASGGKAATGRPRASEGAATNGSKTRQRILDVATQEFSTKGYDGARIDDIMRLSKVSKSYLSLLRQQGEAVHRGAGAGLSGYASTSHDMAAGRLVAGGWNPQLVRSTFKY